MRVMTSTATRKTGRSEVQGRVTQISRSMGGVPKRAVPQVQISAAGLEGDWQEDRKHHGGPDRAVCLFSADLIEALRQEGHPISAGSTGENVTLGGLDWASLVPGARLRFAQGLCLEVTDYATPCKTIAGSFAGGRFVRIGQKVHPGWSRLYARVLAPGPLAQGDAVTVEPAAGVERSTDPG